MKIKRQKHKAFTIVEAVVSAGLMSIVLMCTIQFFNSANKASERVSTYVLTEVSYNTIVEEFRTVHTQADFDSFKVRYENQAKISFPAVEEYIASASLSSYNINKDNLAIMKIAKSENPLNDLIVVQYLN